MNLVDNFYFLVTCPNFISLVNHLRWYNDALNNLSEKSYYMNNRTVETQVNVSNCIVLYGAIVVRTDSQILD